MGMFKGVAVLAAALLVAACGGGGSAGTSPFGTGASGGTGGDGTTATSASDLLVSLDKTSVSNSGTEVVTVTVTAVDASRVALSNVSVAMSVDNNAVAVVPTAVTDTSGKITATVSTGSDRSNRVVSIVARSGAIQKLASFQVTGSALQATLLPAVVAPGSASNKVQYRLVDASAAPMVGQSVTVSGPGLTGATGTTGLNGEFEFSYTAPTAPGSVEITATAGGVTSVQNVIVQSSTGGIANQTLAISSASVQASPSVVNINGTSNVRALFVGSGNTPLPRVRARFDLAGDVNSVGGTLTSGTGIVYSDASGVATTTYTAGTRSGPTDGLHVRVCYSGSDFPVGACPNAAEATLTVVSDALAVSIGTNELLSSGATNLTYVKQYVVLVVDASGQAKADVQITPSIDLKSYKKGFYTTPSNWTRTVTAECVNEDIDRNGVLGAGEDINSSGTLDPRKSDVAITMVGGTRTNANGTAVLQIEYPKNVGSWDTFEILVSASGVAGTEGRTRWRGELPVAAEAVKAEIPPAFVTSPYGTANVCTNLN